MTTKYKTPKQYASWWEQGRKSILQNPLRGRNRGVGDADSSTQGNGQGRKSARSKSASRTKNQTSKTNGAKLRGRSKKGWNKATASSLMSGVMQKNALIILTTMRKWFYFFWPTNINFHDLTTEKVQSLQSLLGLGINFWPAPLRLSPPRSQHRQAHGAIW